MTRKKRAGLFSSAAHEAQTAEPSEARSSSNLFENRMGALADVQSRRSVASTQFEVEPDDCVIWEKHNRIYERLDEANCTDLIAAFKAVGRQQHPALVRRVRGRKRQTFEVIAGVRRLWVVRHLRNNGYPDLKYLVEVRDELSDDVAAFKAMETENRGRNDLSPYEQGLSYKRMLAEAFDGNQTALASAVGRDKSTVSRYLQLAEVPGYIVEAYRELADLSLVHGAKLLQVFKASDRNRDRMLEEAAAIQQIQKEAREQGKPGLGGGAVFKRLIESVERRGGRRGPLQRFGPQDKPHLEVTNKSREGFTVFVPHARGATSEDLLGYFEEAIKAFHSPK